MTDPVRTLWKTRLLSVVVVLISVLGNLSLSWGLKKTALVAGALSPLAFFEAFLSPWVALGIALLILWTLSRMALLSWADLSYVLPVTSAGYALATLAGKFLLAEAVSWPRWAGTLLIAEGTTLVSQTYPSTTEEKPR